MPSITSLQFDTTGWQAVHQTEQQIVWRNGEVGELLSIEFFAQPPEIAFAINDLEGIKAYYQQGSEKDNHTLISVDLTPLQGLDAIHIIFKARNPQTAGFSPLGMRYMGLLVIPLADFSYAVKAQCREHGTTGLREAGVSLALNPQSPKPPVEAKVVNSIEEMFADMRKAPVMVTPADDERYDAMFPQHPLSKVRAYLKHIERTIVIDQEVQTAKRIETRHPTN